MFDVLSDPNLLIDIFRRIIVSAILLVFIIILSLWQRIKMERVFLTSFIRGLIQIILMALVLIILFDLGNLWILYGVLLFMCVFAAYTANRRFNYPGMFATQLLAITVG
ncbi:MAG: ABC transporter permease, partial [Candidatus Hodarchaeota archaeon]